jgi:hypothetical protein
MKSSPLSISELYRKILAPFKRVNKVELDKLLTGGEKVAKKCSPILFKYNTKFWQHLPSKISILNKSVFSSNDEN